MGWAHQDIVAAWGLSRRFELSSGESVLAQWWQIRATAMRYFSRHACALAQRGVRVNRLANIDCLCTHFNRQRNFANHVACVGLGAVVKQQLGHAFITAIGIGAA